MGELSQRVAPCGATLALVMLLGAFGADAQESDDPFAPPQNRIRPPIGVTAQAEEPPESTDPQNRILPPVGVAIRDSASCRVPSPVEVEEPLFDTFWTWLLSHLPVSRPVG